MIKIVSEYHLICEHPECRRQVAQPHGRNFTRFTTCKRHRPAEGFVIQTKSLDNADQSE